MSNFITVDIPFSQFQFKRVSEVMYKQENYQHDYATVQFRDPNMGPKQAKPGTPIRIKIDDKDFFGYIHDVQSIQDNNKNVTKVGIIGASYVMRQASQQMYSEVTVDQVIVEIARKYGFGYKVTPHPRVYRQISQAGLTDWELMVKLAKQSGYFLRAENTVLYFHPFLENFESLSLETPIFTKSNAGFKHKNIMYNFKPIIGETLSHHGADKSATSIAGVNPINGSYFKYTTQRRSNTTRELSNPELFDKHDTSVVANNYATAVYEAISADEKSVFPYIAEAEVLGKSSLHPGMPVYLENVGAEYAGYWTVLSIEHKIFEQALNTQVFTTILTVGTDSLGQTNRKNMPVKPPTTPIRHIIPNQRNTRVLPETKLFLQGLKINPYTKVGLVSRVNRSDTLKGVTSSAIVNKATWKSAQGDLSSKPSPVSKSPAARMKVYANVARS